MRISIKNKIKLIILVILLCIAGGFFIAYYFYNPSRQASSQWIVPNVNTPYSKFITKEALVQQIQQKNELISTETEITEEVSIDDSWGSIPIFKKIQTIQLTGNGIYTIDLSKLSSDNIEINNLNKTITVTSPEPIVKSVTLDEQKTVYKTTENGLLRFGDVKMSAAQLQSIEGSAKSKMTEKMMTPDLFTKAENNTKTTLSNLIKSLLGKDGSNYSIEVKFEK